MAERPCGGHLGEDATYLMCPLKASSHLLRWCTSYDTLNSPMRQLSLGGNLRGEGVPRLSSAERTIPARFAPREIIEDGLYTDRYQMSALR